MPRFVLIYITVQDNNCVRKIFKNGTISTLLPSTIVNRPASVTVSPINDDLYIADTGHHRIRLVLNGTSTSTSIAGVGYSGFSDNVTATTAILSYPHSLSISPLNGDVYFTEYTNVVRKISKSNGFVNVVAGSTTAGNYGNGINPLNALLNAKYGALGVAVSNTGAIFISDTGNALIRMIVNQTITTIGGSGVSGFGGDNGPALNATFKGMTGIAVTSNGNIYVVDNGNKRIRKLYIPTNVSPSTSTVVTHSPTPAISVKTSTNATSSRVNSSFSNNRTTIIFIPIFLLLLVLTW